MWQAAILGEASPSAAVIDRQGVKTTEAGEPWGCLCERDEGCCPQDDDEGIGMIGADRGEGVHGMNKVAHGAQLMTRIRRASPA